MEHDLERDTSLRAEAFAALAGARTDALTARHPEREARVHGAASRGDDLAALLWRELRTSERSLALGEDAERGTPLSFRLRRARAEALREREAGAELMPAWLEPWVAWSAGEVHMQSTRLGELLLACVLRRPERTSAIGLVGALGRQSAGRIVELAREHAEHAVGDSLLRAIERCFAGILARRGAAAAARVLGRAALATLATGIEPQVRERFARRAASSLPQVLAGELTLELENAAEHTELEALVLLLVQQGAGA